MVALTLCCYNSAFLSYYRPIVVVWESTVNYHIRVELSHIPLLVLGRGFRESGYSPSGMLQPLTPFFAENFLFPRIAKAIFKQKQKKSKFNVILLLSFLPATGTQLKHQHYKSVPKRSPSVSN